MRAIALVVSLTALVTGCSPDPGQETPLRTLAVADLEGVIARDEVELDAAVTADANGAIRIRADEPRTVRLYELGDLDVEAARLTYRAKLRTENVQGKAYLEMWCRFPGKGEFFSRALDQPLSGTNEWTTQETPFFLQRGQNPDNVRLNLVLDGTGVVWIDEIEVTQTPL